jgi:hypothetical protein
MANYDNIDFSWSWSGDYEIDGSGDLKDTSFDYIQSLKNEIMTIVKSEVGDWKASPNYAATLSDYVGEPNTRENGKSIEERITSALTSNSVVNRGDLQVRVVPVNIHQVMVMIRVQAQSTAQNSLVVGEPISVNLVYDSNENNIFFMPSNLVEREKKGF